nr:class I SAM-dependent methyltransferase [uncultured Agathobaculum sp.]
MVLTPRLACLAALVPQGARLADVGTDHGKLPISLLLEGRIAYAIGSDIGVGPLAHAALNAREHGVTLPLRRAPGLDAVRPSECDTVSIAGMGGQTIAQILQNAPWTRAGAHLLLLQPMTMVYELRQWLWAHGYAIEQEAVCREDRRRYVVLSVRGGAPAKEVPLAQCVVSPALLRAPGAADYLQQLLTREMRAKAGLERAKTHSADRLAAQNALVQAIRQALEECK